VDHEEAKDVVQESFIQAFNSIGQLKDPSIFGGWLRKIIINTCLQKCRNRSNYKALTENEAFIQESNVDDTWYREAQAAALHAAIKSLPEGCRQIFLLYALEDYTHKEIATLLKVSESTSKSQYLRAKHLLQQQLKYVNG